MKKIFFICFLFFSNNAFAGGYDVFGIGYYDVKFDGSSGDEAIDFRYERRFEKSLLRIGPESYDFFNLNPFAGFEFTSDSASYSLAGIYLDDNLGTIFTGKKYNYNFTPSIGVGAYDDGDGKALGNTIEFRTTFEVSYQLDNKNRIGFSIGHISNANIGSSNPGVEIISLNYQIKY